jgi:hypothetical protein
VVPCFDLTPPRPPCPGMPAMFPPTPIRGPVVNTHPCPTQCLPRNSYCPNCPNPRTHCPAPCH